MKTLHCCMVIQKFGAIYTLFISRGKSFILNKLSFTKNSSCIYVLALLLVLDGHKAEMLPSGSFRARRDYYGGEQRELERLRERDLD